MKTTRQNAARAVDGTTPSLAPSSGTGAADQDARERSATQRGTDKTTATRFIFRDDEGAWVETHVCETRDQAIRLFCYPALLWPPFEHDGWTITEEPL